MKARVLGLLGGVVGLVWPDDALAQPSPHGQPGNRQPAYGQPEQPQPTPGQPAYGQPTQPGYYPPPPPPPEGSFLDDSFLFLIPGYLFSKGNGPFPGGHGVEVSLQGYGDQLGRSPVGLGLFGQAQSFGDGSRYAGGLQSSFSLLMFSGVEAGLARRGAQSGYGATTSAHLGVFVSLIVVNVGLRWDIPVSSSGPSPGVDRAFFVSLKLPFCVMDRGHFNPFTPIICPHIVKWPGGRPLEVEREARAASLIRAEGWG